MKFTGAGFLLLLTLTNSATANACTLAEAQNSFSQLNRVFLSYNGAIIDEKKNQPKTTTPTNAQATPEAATQTIAEAKTEVKTGTEEAEAGAETPTPPPTDKLSGLLEKRADIIAQTATIRKMFAEEVQNNPDMKAQDALNPVICEKFAAVAKNHDVIIQHTTTAKEERPVCTKKDLSPRFIAATRMQRKLTLAGKVNGKERVSYLKMVIQFKKNSKKDFDQACNTLHEYEKRLKAEKSNE